MARAKPDHDDMRASSLGAVNGDPEDLAQDEAPLPARDGRVKPDHADISASPSEIKTFQPASDRPRNRQAASVQLTTRLLWSWFKKSPMLPVGGAGTPAQSVGPAHHPHSMPA